MNFFSSMIPKRKLGEIIALTNKKKADIAKAEMFLKLLREQRI